MKHDLLSGYKTTVIASFTFLLVHVLPANTHSASGDTLFARKDTTAAEDTLRSRFIPGLGSLTGVIDSSGMFHRSKIVWTDAKYFGDLTWRIPGFFVTDLGEAGMPNLLTAFGVGGSNISILLDGRPLNDPVTGVFNLYDMPLEFVEQIELSQGSESFLFGLGGLSATLNFVTRQFNSLRPITKVRYIQSQSETILTDILFTQNVARSLNLMVGFQRHASDGRYTNAGLDAWNLRTRLRYNVSDRLNISLTDFYTKTANRVNGGVELPTTVYDNVAAAVKFGEASEKLSRRDLTLSMIGKLLEDSASVSQMSMYYTKLDRQYDDPAVMYGNSHSASFLGMRLTQTLAADVGDIQLGFDYQQRKVDGSIVSDDSHSTTGLFGKITMNFGAFLQPSFFGRYEIYRNQHSFSFGSKISVKVWNGISIFAGFNQFVSYPTLLEAYSSDTSIIRISGVQNQHHRFIETGIRFMPDSSFALSLSGFRHSIREASGLLLGRIPGSDYPRAIITGPFDSQVQGINGSMNFRFWKLEGYGTLTFTDFRQGDTSKTLVPRLLLAGELSYRDRLFNDALDAKVGFRSRFTTEHRGLEFIPYLSLFAENLGPRPGQFTTFDVFAVLRIGDAYLTLSWENLLDTHYFISPIYPMPGRNFRFGVDWVFVD